MPTYIALRSDFLTNHKVIALGRRAGKDVSQNLLKLWLYAAELYPDGDISSMTPEQVSLVAGLDGSENFYQCLLDVGLLEKEEGRTIIHGWKEHQGRIKRRNGKSQNTDDENDPGQEGKRRYLDHVFLSDQEVANLEARMGRDRCERYIERLNDYIAQIGTRKARARYKSHYHTILNWYRRDEDETVRRVRVMENIAKQKESKYFL